MDESYRLPSGVTIPQWHTSFLRSLDFPELGLIASLTLHRWLASRPNHDFHSLPRACPHWFLDIWHTVLGAYSLEVRVQALIVQGRQVRKGMVLSLVIEVAMKEVNRICTCMVRTASKDRPQVEFRSVGATSVLKAPEIGTSMVGHNRAESMRVCNELCAERVDECCPAKGQATQDTHVAAEQPLQHTGGHG